MKRKLQIIISASAASVLAFSTLAQDTPEAKKDQPDYIRQPMARPRADRLNGAAKASDIIGMTVKNYQDEKLGKVEDLTLDMELRVWLWLENRRLGCDFRSATDYALSRINKWPLTRSWRNRLSNIRVFGPRALLLHGRHPREKILNALVLLLWVRTEAAPGFARTVRRELLWSEPSALIPAYRKRWGRAN